LYIQSRASGWLWWFGSGLSIVGLVLGTLTLLPVLQPKPPI
jgi:hypothetical protein